MSRKQHYFVPRLESWRETPRIHARADGVYIQSEWRNRAREHESRRTHSFAKKWLRGQAREPKRSNVHGKHFARIRTMLGRHRLISTQTHRALGCATLFHAVLWHRPEGCCIGTVKDGADLLWAAVVITVYRNARCSIWNAFCASSCFLDK